MDLSARATNRNLKKKKKLKNTKKRNPRRSPRKTSEEARKKSCTDSDKRCDSTEAKALKGKSTSTLASLSNVNRGRCSRQDSTLFASPTPRSRTPRGRAPDDPATARERARPSVGDAGANTRNTPASTSGRASTSAGGTFPKVRARRMSRMDSTIMAVDRVAPDSPILKRAGVGASGSHITTDWVRSRWGEATALTTTDVDGSLAASGPDSDSGTGPTTRPRTARTASARAPVHAAAATATGSQNEDERDRPRGDLLAREADAITGARWKDSDG